jgi:mycothiol synthase
MLVETVPIAPVGFNWDLRRWEGRRYYDPRDGGDPHWHQDGRLWQVVDGPIVAVVHPEGSGEAALQVHPDYRYLEADLIIWAEAELASLAEGDRGRQIQLFVFDYDAHRHRLLAARGYEQMPYGGVTRHLRLGHQPLVRPSLSPGYTLRVTNPEEPADARQIADLLNAAFGRDFHNPAEYQQFTRQASCFRPELDLVAVAPDGTFAAYVGIPYDAANRRGIFEPVCTHPEHRQRGLARSLMQEGLIRLRALGAFDVIVDTGDMIPANRLYDSLGFGEVYRGHHWRKLLG